MKTPNRSVRFSDEAMEFLDGLRIVYGSHDKGMLAISRICTPDVLALDVGGPIEESVELSKPEMIDSLKGVIQNIEAGVVQATPEQPKARAESVAEKKQRLEREHAVSLAESDVTARLVGRHDIEYDLENVAQRSRLPVQAKVVTTERHHYEVQAQKVKTLARPHGAVDAKRRREQ